MVSCLEGIGIVREVDDILVDGWDPAAVPREDDSIMPLCAVGLRTIH
jgi:hypothetical protein